MLCLSPGGQPGSLPHLVVRKARLASLIITAINALAVLCTGIF
jgi:hypothetical protein